MNKQEFWDNIEHTDDDIKKGEFFIKHRGLDAHIYVLDYLKSIKPGNISYKEISTTMRYDKRIRRIIYKYVGFFEEYIRAFIVNKYRDNVKAFNHTRKVDTDLLKGISLFATVEDLNMGQLFNQVAKLSGEDKLELFEKDIYTKASMDAIRELRNQVSHNKFLLNNLSLKAPRGNMSSLYANVKNLYDYLPYELKEPFKNELNNAKSSKAKLKDYQTEWCLVESIIIKI